MREIKTLADVHKDGRWTVGGRNGSHWKGCEEVHWDCKIVHQAFQIADLQDQLNKCKPLIASNELINEIIEAGCDFDVCYEYAREWSETNDYFYVWKCFITRWENKKKHIPFGCWNNAIDKENDVWDKTHTREIAIQTAYNRWKEEIAEELNEELRREDGYDAHTAYL